MQNKRAKKQRIQSVYFRRCHVCGCTSNDQVEVLACRDCGKPFSKYYFCEHFHQFIQTDRLNSIQHGRRPSRPLIGISLIWKTRSS